ncbi:MAG: hypothetical protein WBW84_17130 [Acidobacteriaceae bacterium]
MIEIEAQQELGRAKNAIQEHLIRKLLVPKIYLDADWCGEHVDVLAVDRAGVGDVHVVRIVSEVPYLTGRPSDESILVSTTQGLDRDLAALTAIAGHYRYIAALVAGSRSKDYHPAARLLKETLAKDGVGRIGILFVDLSGNEPVVTAIVRAERYRSSSQIVEITDKYVASNQANWEVRE